MTDDLSWRGDDDPEIERLRLSARQEQLEARIDALAEVETPDPAGIERARAMIHRWNLDFLAWCDRHGQPWPAALKAETEALRAAALRYFQRHERGD